MFVSNFPVDRMFGTFDDLYGTYEQVTGGARGRGRAHAGR
jgi:hypothetical protein